MAITIDDRFVNRFFFHLINNSNLVRKTIIVVHVQSVRVHGISIRIVSEIGVLHKR